MTELTIGNIPQRHNNANIAIYKPCNISQQTAIKSCLNYIDNGLDNIKSGKGLFLHGPVGTGKTHLAIAILKAMLNKYSDEYKRDKTRSYFISVVDLLDIIKSGFDGSEYRKEKAKDTLFNVKYYEIVVLDDIGAEKPTEWVEERLYSIIDSRYRQQKATIFTTNCSISELENQLGKRIISRIIEMTDGIKVDGPDYRKRKLA